MSYYRSKGDRVMTDLAEAYGQIVDKREILNERTIASYEGGTNREVIEELLPAAAAGLRVAAPVIARGAAKLAPKIVKGAKALMPGAKAAAKQIGGAAVTGAAQGVQQRVQNKVAGQQAQQEQEEVNRAAQEGDPIRDENEEGIGSYIDIADDKGGGTGEIVGIVSNPADTYVIQTDDDEILHLHKDDIMVISNQSTEVDLDTGRIPVGNY
jgi:hypothetical protein